MSVTSVNLYSESYTDRIEGGYLKLDYTRTYLCIFTDPVADSAIVIGNDPRLPARGTQWATSNGYAFMPDSSRRASISV